MGRKCQQSPTRATLIERLNGRSDRFSFVMQCSQHSLKLPKRLISTEAT
jgi:hypothetical protein